jgi:hypothetical protein
MYTNTECIFAKFWKILLYHQYIFSQIDDMNAEIYLFGVKYIEANYKILLR